MTSIKIFLFVYPLLATLPLCSMDQSLSLSDQSFKIPKNSQVPTLRQTILSKLATHFIESDDRTLLEAFKARYPEVIADCARTLAEDQKVLLWNIFGQTGEVIILDHEALVEKMPDRANKILASAFSPDGKYLLTLTWRKAQEKHWVIYVWSVAALKDYEKLVKATSKEKNGSLGQSPVEGLRPYSEFVLGVAKREASYKDNCLVFNASGNLLAVCTEKDCYVLSFDSGQMARLWRVNILPQAKVLNAQEGSDEESLIYKREKDHDFAIVSVMFHDKNNALLLLVRANYLFLGNLYSLSLENQAVVYAPYPYINSLDDAHIIAEHIITSACHPDGRILVVPGDPTIINPFVDDIKTDYPIMMLRTLDSSGKLIRQVNLQVDSNGQQAFVPLDIKLIPQQNRLFLHSRCIFPDDRYSNGYSNHDPRIDTCDLATGVCTLFHNQSNHSLVPFGENWGQAQNLDIMTLPDNHCALKRFIGSRPAPFWIALWDKRDNSHAKILSYKKPWEKEVRVLAPQGEYLFLGDRSPLVRHAEVFKPSCIPLRTPYADSLSLEELIVLAKLKKHGLQWFEDHKEYVALYEAIGETSPETAHLKKAIHEYFQKLRREHT